MEWAPQILVIILSVTLAIFLVLAIVLIVLLIKVTRQIKAVTDTAGRTAVNVENFVAGVSKATSPIFIAKLVSNLIKKKRK